MLSAVGDVGLALFAFAVFALTVAFALSLRQDAVRETTGTTSVTRTRTRDQHVTRHGAAAHKAKWSVRMPGGI